VASFEVESALSALDVGIIVLDAQSTIVEWNDWVARTTGISRQSALGRNLIAVFPSLENTRFPAVISDALLFGSSSILTHTLNRLLPLTGDDARDLLHNVVVRPISSGQSAFCLLQITDVTVSVTRERVLRDRQNARYHAIVDSARDTIITTGTDRKIQWVNAAAEQAFGYAPVELLGQDIDLLIDHGQAAGESHLGELVGGNSSTIQVAGRRKNGEVAHFAVSLGRWKAGDHAFITSIWRDVTEQMAAVSALRESENRHRALLEALPQLVWTCGADGNCDYLNPQWEHYTGVPAKQHLGWAWLDIIHTDDREALEAAWWRSLASGNVFDADARLCRSNRTHRWFKFRSIPVHSADEKIVRWFGTATDITDHIEARDTLRRSNDDLESLVVERTREREVVLQQLHEAQKMESIGQLTGGVAHDFNNLLAVVLGSLSLLKKNLPDDPRTSRLIEGAIQGAERGATLTKRLLAFARRQELKLEAIDLNALFPDLLEFLRQSVGPNIAISLDISDDVHPVNIDANQFELALMNLAVNARDAMPKGGVLTIKVRDEVIGGGHDKPKDLPQGQYVRIDVADTGTGMSEATLAKAMEPFFTTKGVGKGTGLGLSMVQGLAAQSGGGLTISSTPGKGTTISLWFPCARREDIQTAPEKPAQIKVEDRSRGSRILLVDDDPLVSMNTAYMLMDLGHSVLEAPSGPNALRVLETDAQFDVIITDYAMPGMTGLDLAEKIKQLRPKIPIIIATGYAELPPGATLEFPRLSKPYSQQELCEALERASRSLR